MSCPICNRNNCCPSFHSLEAQEEYEKDHEYCIAKIESLENKVELLESEIEALEADIDCMENGTP
jgi:chaperonin cofactor prefoldin